MNLNSDKEAINDLILGLDPLRFAAKLGFPNLDPWQKELLLSNDKKLAVLVARQLGKTTITAIKALHTILYNKNTLCLIVSPSLRQSREFFKKLTDFYTMLGGEVTPDALTSNKSELELKNGSRVLSMPSSSTTIRGYSIDLCIIDEAAQVSDDVYTSLLPALSVTEGTLILLSTPWGFSGKFFELYTNGGDSWRRFKIDAYQCPRISAEFLADAKRTMSKFEFDSEYLCEWSSDSSQFFDSEEIRRAITDEVKPLKLDLKRRLSRSKRSMI